MAQIDWDQIGQRYYENGVSRGVFYPQEAPGIPWNGLTGVTQASGDSLDPLYFDGVKYEDVVTTGDFSGKMTAFTYPDEFLEYEGIWEAENGFALGYQPKARFGLCYRTEIGNDLGTSVGYKLHLIYNLLAVPAEKEYETLALDAEPVEFEWDISAIPEQIDNFRDTAYVVIDSRRIDPYLLLDIENILYGTSTEDPLLPQLNSLVSFVKSWGRLIITDLGNGKWEASSSLPGVITMIDAETFQINSDTAVYLDPETYEISSSAEEGGIWP